MDQRETVNKSKTALIAMSGGVDSSVAAMLTMQMGYDCIGCTMRLYDNDMIGEDLLGSCCSVKETEDARSVCENLSLPYRILHCETEFRDRVIEPFVSSYEKGETPNPCILCNRHLKFDTLYQKGREMGFSTIVTGHYARIVKSGDHFYLKTAVDPSKDQSYVLYSMTEEQLRHTLFPLGDYTKDQVRALAAEAGFRNAEKAESQDICFVPDGDYPAMIERYRNRTYPEGDFVDTEGHVLGRHKGIIHYTVGQRRGLGIASEGRLYVKCLDVPNNRVVLSDNERLFEKDLTFRDFHWITGAKPTGNVEVTAKIRYRHEAQPATLIPIDEEHAALHFREAQRAITPGQSVVLYDGDTVLGGGTITG